MMIRNPYGRNIRMSDSGGGSPYTNRNTRAANFFNQPKTPVPDTYKSTSVQNKKYQGALDAQRQAYAQQQAYIQNQIADRERMAREAQLAMRAEAQRKAQEYAAQLRAQKLAEEQLRAQQAFEFRAKERSDAIGFGENYGPQQEQSPISGVVGMDLLGQHENRIDPYGITDWYTPPNYNRFDPFNYQNTNLSRETTQAGKQVDPSKFTVGLNPDLMEQHQEQIDPYGISNFYTPLPYNRFDPFGYQESPGYLGRGTTEAKLPPLSQEAITAGMAKLPRIVENAGNNLFGQGAIDRTEEMLVNKTPPQALPPIGFGPRNTDTNTPDPFGYQPIQGLEGKARSFWNNVLSESGRALDPYGLSVYYNPETHPGSDPFWNAISQESDYPYGYSSEFWDKVRESVEGGINKAGDAIEKFDEKVTDKIPGIVDKIPGIVQGTGEFLGELPQRVMDAAGETVNKYDEGFTNIIGNMFERPFSGDYLHRLMMTDPIKALFGGLAYGPFPSKQDEQQEQYDPNDPFGYNQIPGFGGVQSTAEGYEEPSSQFVPYGTGWYENREHNFNWNDGRSNEFMPEIWPEFDYYLPEGDNNFSAPDYSWGEMPSYDYPSYDYPEYETPDYGSHGYRVSAGSGAPYHNFQNYAGGSATYRGSGGGGAGNYKPNYNIERSTQNWYEKMLQWNIS